VTYLSTFLQNPYNLLISYKPTVPFTIFAVSPFHKPIRVILKVKELYVVEGMGLIVRSKPVGAKYMEGYPQLKEMLQKVGWLKLIDKFDGFHKEITKSFARYFDGTEVEIRDIKFEVTESFITEAIELPRHGERWFKNKEFHSKSWKVILKNPGMDVSVFRKGIPISALKSKWRNMLLILHKFITCEGRFGCMYVYHIFLFMNFLENGEINFPFFLLNNLRRMASNVQNKIEFIDTTMYHHRLIKVLIEYYLKGIGDVSSATNSVYKG